MKAIIYFICLFSSLFCYSQKNNSVPPQKNIGDLEMDRTDLSNIQFASQLCKSIPEGVKVKSYSILGKVGGNLKMADGSGDELVDNALFILNKADFHSKIYCDIMYFDAKTKKMYSISCAIRVVETKKIQQAGIDFIFKGKLLETVLGKGGSQKEFPVKVPLESAKVIITCSNDKGNEGIKWTRTDKFGDFSISVPENMPEYNLTIEPVNKGTQEITLVTQNGEEITNIKRTERGFNYKLIPADVVRLREMPEEDISSTFNSFKNSEKKEISITEKIVYASGQYQIDPQSIPTLNKVVKILNENPETKLDIISHTDSNGDDESNLSLSQKRAASVVKYLVTKGVAEARLNPIGKGETQIRNRCQNGVECSDKEHEFNRRTEFYFVK